MRTSTKAANSSRPRSSLGPSGLERRGWRCVKNYRPQAVPARTPLLLVSGAGVAVTLCVLAVPGGWAFYEAPRGRGGFLCFCGGDIKHAAQVIDRFLLDGPPQR
ncbi:hypothetical protein [Actinomadura sp. 3N407]|uniref:hypothetical protein n=1 Tax=Actinomadura sp. 3N407 TaxID=3457423 RepID=UPI003FCCC944